MTLALVTALGGTGLFAAPALAAGELSTSITITSITADSQAAFIPTTFHITTTVEGISEPSPCPSLIKIYEIIDDTPVEVMSQEFCAWGGSADLVYQAGFDLGTHTFKAAWVIDPTNHYASSESPTVDKTMVKTDSTTSLFADVSAEVHTPTLLQAAVGAWTNAFATGATIKFYRSGSATPLCTVAARTDNMHTCTTTFATAGTYTMTAVYSGNTWVNGSTSDPVTLTVTPDTVHGTATIQYANFYPVTDGYRDALSISGTRSEQISVVARVYSPGGTLLKTYTKAAGAYPYAFSWNGRNSSGVILPEGRYKIVQVQKDAFNTTKTFTHYVNLSKKKLTTLTKVISKKGNAATAGGVSGTGVIYESTTSGYILMKPGSSGWTGVGYQFTIPTATIYKSIKFRIYGKHGMTAPPSTIGMQNFSWCPYSSSTDWDEYCFDRLQTFGNTANSLAWYTTTGSLSTNKSGQIVRGMVSNTVGPAYVYKAEVVVTYQVLTY